MEKMVFSKQSIARILNPSKNSKNHGENISSLEPLVCYQSMVFQWYDGTRTASRSIISDGIIQKLCCHLDSRSSSTHFKWLIPLEWITNWPNCICSSFYAPISYQGIFNHFLITRNCLVFQVNGCWPERIDFQTIFRYFGNF